MHQLDLKVLGDVTERHEAFFISYKCYADTDTAETTGSSNSVQIRLSIMSSVACPLHRDIVIDDHGYGRYVDSTCENVRRDEDFGFTRPEVIQQGISIFPLIGSVKDGNPVAISGHALSDLVGTFACLELVSRKVRGIVGAYMIFGYLDEDDGRADVHQAVELAKNLVFIHLRWAVHIHLRDAFDREFLFLQFYLISARRIGLCILHDLIRKSSREEKNLDVLRQQSTCDISIKVGFRGDTKTNSPLDLYALVSQSLLVQHVISLVNNENFQVRDIHLLESDEVTHCARCSYNDGGLDQLVPRNSTFDSGGSD